MSIKLKFKPVVVITKRQRFLTATIIVALGLLATQVVPESLRLIFIFSLGLISYSAALWAISEDIKGWEYLTLFILPVVYTIVVSLFYFLLPVRWLTRFPVVILFAIGYYALLLTENIFNVASARNIQLLRAASAVGYYATVFVFILFCQIIYTFHLNFVLNLLLIFLAFFMLSFQFFWSIELEKGSLTKVLTFSLSLAMLLGETGSLISFWAINPTLSALILGTLGYLYLSICRNYYLSFQVGLRQIIEPILIFAGILLFVLQKGSWGGE